MTAISQRDTTGVANLVRTIWSETFYDQLNQTNIYAPKFLRADYQGDLGMRGDTVKIQQIQRPSTASLSLASATSAQLDVYTEQALTVSQIEIKAQDVAECSIAVNDLLTLQSIEFLDKLRMEMMGSVLDTIEDKIISLLVASASSPDHDHDLATDNKLTYAEVVAARTALSAQHVPRDERYAVLGTTLYGDILTKTDFIDAERVGTMNLPTNTGLVTRAAGFDIYESDAQTATDAFFFHKSAGALVVQKQPMVKISDRHAGGKRGYLITIEAVYGFKLMDGKRIYKLHNA